MANQLLNPSLFDVSSGKQANLPAEQIPDAITSGKYAYQKGHDIPVINPEGESGTIPSEQAADAFRVGYKFEPVQAQQDRIKTQEYSGPLNAAAAAAAGALRGPTLGLSDQLFTKSGLVDPQALSDLQKYRPGWSMTGELGGVLGSLAVMPESIPGQLAKLGTAVKGASEAKMLAGAGRVMELAGLEGNPIAAKILSTGTDIGSSALGSAVEGAIYSGVGNSISEQALGDPQLNGEKVFSNFGYGALFGGALGGVLKSAEIGVPASVEAAKSGVTALRDFLIGSGEGDAGLMGKVLPEHISDILGNRAISLGKDELNDLAKGTASKLNDVHNNNETTLKTLNKEIRPQETDALIDTADPRKVLSSKYEVLNSMDETLQALSKEPDYAFRKAARELENAKVKINGLGDDAKPLDVFNALRDIKQDLGNKIFSKIPNAQETDAINALNEIKNKINGVLKDPDVFGFAGSSLAAHDSMLSKYYSYISPGKASEFQKAFMKRTGQGPLAKWQFDPTKVERVLKSADKLAGQEKLKLLDGYWGMLKELPEHLENTYANVPNERFDPTHLKNIIENSKASTNQAIEKFTDTIKNSTKGLPLGDYFAAHLAMSHPVVGAAIGAYNVATKPLQHFNKLAELERIIGKTSSAIARGAAGAISKSAEKALPAAGAAAGLSYDKAKEEHKKFSDDLISMNSNPNALISKVADATEHVHDAAPGMAESIQSTAIRAAQFLASKLPPTPANNPFETRTEPSPADIAKFNSYRDIVEKPTLAFDQIKSRTLTNATVETLQAVYPALYEYMKQSLLAASMKNAESLPYQTKQQVSFFLGQPVTASLSPMSIQMNQQAMIASQMQSQMPQGGKTSKQGMQKMTIADRTGVERPREKA